MNADEFPAVASQAIRLRALIQRMRNPITVSISRRYFASSAHHSVVAKADLDFKTILAIKRKQNNIKE